MNIFKPNEVNSHSHIRFQYTNRRRTM